MEKDTKKIIAGVGILGGAGLVYLLTRKACTEGSVKCTGTDLYACVNGTWQLEESNSPACEGDGIPQVCTKDSDCPDWFRCIDGACVPY